MCRLFLQISPEQQTAAGWLVSYANSLLKQSICDESGRPNADGWGTAWLENQTFTTTKSARPAFLDPDYLPTCRRIKSRIILGHIRRGSVGTISFHNAHPFQFDDWVFAHNGSLPDFNTHPEYLMDRIQEKFRKHIKGQTDSERIFYYFLSSIGDLDVSKCKNTLLKHLATMTSYLIDKCFSLSHKDAVLNYLLIHPNIQIGFRFKRNLVYFCDSTSILIASEPIKGNTNWKEINEREFFVVSNHRIAFYSLEKLLKTPADSIC